MMLLENEIMLLKKYFVFDKIFNLLDYDSDMSKLYDELKGLSKNVYENNYRFIFLHYDLDYFITENTPGLTLINLQRILVSLDIPNFFCLILSQQNLQKMCDIVREQFSSDEWSITVINNYLNEPMHTENFKEFDSNLAINENLISKKYVSLNRQVRLHRRILTALLNNKKLINDGIVSYGSTI